MRPHDNRRVVFVRYSKLLCTIGDDYSQAGLSLVHLAAWAVCQRVLLEAQLLLLLIQSSAINVWEPVSLDVCFIHNSQT